MICNHFANVAQNADIQISAISALKMFADSRYADIEKKSADMPILPIDIADADINIGTPLLGSHGSWPTLGN